MPIDAERIHKPVRRLRKVLKKLPSQPSSKTIHDLRTNSRRFETTLDALGLSQRNKEKKLLRHLSMIRKRAGKVRDQDVLIGYALNVDVEDEQDCLMRILEKLGSDRRKQVKKLRKLNAKIGPDLRRMLKRSEAQIVEMLHPGTRQQFDSNRNAPAEAQGKAVELTEELRQPKRLNHRNLHSYRLKVKALQYVLQLAGNANRKDFVKTLRQVKDAIGEWHDWNVLLGCTKDVIDHGARCRLLAAVREAVAAKYDHALSVTNHMRREYLVQHSPRQKRHRRQRVMIKRPVLVATTALAG
jgi:CHAD domain-containing protein